jgi:hypothetical protein
MTRLWRPSLALLVAAGGDESVGTDPQLADVHTSETIVNPRLIQHLYAAPSECVTLNVLIFTSFDREYIRTTQSSRGVPCRLSHEAVARQGLVEFDDFYRERDVCQSANLLGGPRSWLKPPDVSASPEDGSVTVSLWRSRRCTRGSSRSRCQVRADKSCSAGDLLHRHGVQRERERHVGGDAGRGDHG